MGKPKKTKTPGELRSVLAANAKNLIDQRHVQLRTETERFRAVASAIGTSVSTVQRICQGAVGCELETLEAFAKHLKVSPWQLIHPAPQHIQAAENADAFRFALKLAEKYAKANADAKNMVKSILRFRDGGGAADLEKTVNKS